LQNYNAVKEVDRNEFESRYNRQINDETGYGLGKRLRSNERLNLANEDLDELYSPSQREYQKKQPKTAAQQIIENSYVGVSMNSPPNSFQMKNIVNNTEYIRKRAKESPGRVSAISEIPSKYEDLREETAYYKRNEDYKGQQSPRSRSPFNVSQSYNLPSRHETLSTKYSPAEGSLRSIYDEPQNVNELKTSVLRQRQNEIPPPTISAQPKDYIETREPRRIKEIENYRND